MAKETVRYPDRIVEEIDGLVEEGTFESKSEFYRFSAEFVLDLVDPEYEEETFNYAELKEELGVDVSSVREDVAAADGGFLQAVITVRKYGMRGEYEEAESFVDSNFDRASPAGLVLEELLATHRET